VIGQRQTDWLIDCLELKTDLDWMFEGPSLPAGKLPD